jgi:uncharacterized protein (TIRG00374 family)
MRAHRDARVRDAHWISWLFGAALLLALAAIVSGQGEGARFVQLALHASPLWLALGLIAQLGTYVADARILQIGLRRAGIAGALRGYMGLGFAKLFIDNTVPTGGVTGTLLLVRALDRRGVARGASMAAVVVNLVSHYAAHMIAVGFALGVIWSRGGPLRVFAGVAALFALLAVVIPAVLLGVSSGEEDGLPNWVERIPVVRSWLRALSAATPEIAHDARLIARSALLQLAVLALDAFTLWAMLRAIGYRVSPAGVFASFMLATLVRMLSVLPGGLGLFETTSVAALHVLDVPVSAGLAATLMFRVLAFWLPMLPGTLFARRETRAA